jgi:hypothetical protein
LVEEVARLVAGLLVAAGAVAHSAAEVLAHAGKKC